MSANAHRRPAPPTGWAAVSVAARACSAGGLRGKRLLGLVTLVGLPIAVQLILLAFGGGRGTAFASFADRVNNAYLGAIVPLVLIFLGTAAFGDEWEGGTAHYLLGVALPRPALVLGRFLAAARRACLLLLPALALLFVLCVAPHEGALSYYLADALKVLAVLLLAILAYTAVFLLAGLWLRRSIMSAFIYVLVFEGLIGHLPSGFAALSISFHARNLLFRGTAAETFRPERMQDLGVQPPSAIASVVTLAIFLAVFLAAAVVVLKRKEFTGSGQQAESAPGA
ncbi:MAG: hypothetical protein FJ296_09875 [Planctomycetes bacterium]|nr:hypothetical protein [Planctomycetota bacterium]